jgi:hypothetical protein
MDTGDRVGHDNNGLLDIMVFWGVLMLVLDLFSGLGGWSQAFKDRGHQVVTLDINHAFKPDITADIMTITKDNILFKPDIILASPPCEKFSVCTIGRNWEKSRPKTEEAKKAIELVMHTLKLIDDLKPKFWIMENPTGMLRTIIGKPQAMITQCQYGRESRKPTDLWGLIPPSFISKKCRNGSPCHQPAPRKSKTGIQGIQGKDRAARRALIPYDLSLEICKAAEADLEKILPKQKSIKDVF